MNDGHLQGPGQLQNPSLVPDWGGAKLSAPGELQQVPKKLDFWRFRACKEHGQSTRCWANAIKIHTLFFFFFFFCG